MLSMNKALSTLIRFQKDLRPHLPVHTTTPYPFWKRFYTLNAHGQMNSTHAHFNISARKIGAKLNPYGSVCPPFWIVTVEWAGPGCVYFDDVTVFG